MLTEKEQLNLNNAETASHQLSKMIVAEMNKGSKVTDAIVQLLSNDMKDSITDAVDEHHDQVKTSNDVTKRFRTQIQRASDILIEQDNQDRYEAYSDGNENPDAFDVWIVTNPSNHKRLTLTFKGKKGQKYAVLTERKEREKPADPTYLEAIAKVNDKYGKDMSQLLDELMSLVAAAEVEVAKAA